MKKWLIIVALAFVALALAIQMDAITTRFWRSSGYQQLAQGRLAGLSLNPEGRLALAPRLAEVMATGQALIWTMTSDPAGNAYLATGNHGEVFRLTPAQLAGAASAPGPEPPKAYFSAPDPDVFALAIGPDGDLYAGTSPDGKVYRITAAGQSEVYFDPHAKYIWSLTFLGPTLYVGTGDDGEIYRVTAAGQGGKFLDTRQQQVMALAGDGQGNLLAGTSPSGLVYRIQPDGAAAILYHSDLTEIHSIRLGSQGDVYVAAQGASGAPHPAFSAPLVPPTPPAVIASGMTITIASAKTGALPPPPPPAAPEFPAPMVLTDSAVAHANAALTSAVYRISASGAVSTVWNSHGDAADDVLPLSAGLLLATDHQGRIYDLGDDRSGEREATVVAQTEQAETTRLLKIGDAIFATTRDQGNLYRLSPTPGERGTYESPVRDTGSISRFGHLTFIGVGAIAVMTRSGNSAVPDFTWSPWSSPTTHSGTPIASPNARFIQWKAQLSQTAGDPPPSLDEVDVPYLPANQPPEISSLETTVADHGIQLHWNASDPDGDHLTYSISFKGQGETAWKQLKAHLTASTFAITPAMLPDGSYTFRVVASDAADNPVGEGLSAERVSAAVVLDSTPPVVRQIAAGTVRPGHATDDAAPPGGAVAHFSARSSLSPLSHAEFAVDGGPWQMLLSDDGMIDSAQESFTVHAQHLSPGEHVLLLRVSDEAGNQGGAKAVVVVR